MAGLSDMIDRAAGALIGGALGDALGMPTQLLSPEQIEASYRFVDRFIEPAPDHPVSRGLAAGTITDDTEQALLLGRILVSSTNGFDDKGWINALLGWEREVKARGSYDLLGPSTKRALDAINDGFSPYEAGRYGDTNGAAMRIAPIGILMPAEPVGALVAKVAETCRATHNTSIAIASASAVAAAVSAGVAGCDWRQASLHAAAAAREGAKLGHWVTGGDIAARIEWAQELVRGNGAPDAIRLVTDLIGTGVASQESVPAAFAVLEIADGDPWQAAVISANLGGDTDTIGAIAAGMAGACAGLSRLPREHVAQLRGIDLADVQALAADLVAARIASASGKEGSMRAGRLVHVGSAVVDYVYRIDALPTPGEDKIADAYDQVIGGGFNMMAAAARTGMKVVFGGQHGTGPVGDFLRRALAAESIEILAPKAPDRDTGNCVVLVTADAERTFVSIAGAEGFLTPASLATVRPKAGDWVFTSGYTLTYPGSREVLADWIDALPEEIKFVLDPTSVVAGIPRNLLVRVLKRTNWLSCNTYEAGLIAGQATVEENAANLLSDHCPNAAGVVIRQGERGCHVRLADGTARHIPAFAVAAIDTNGAGDTHVGGFVSALSRGADPFEAARYANAAAAILVTRHGGSSAPTHAEIEVFLSRADAPAAGTRNEKASA
jgi:ADP-ribosylglycohydrolase/sugar/nucleoside kinase (ribokinase family)